MSHSLNIVIPIYNEDESVLPWLQQVVSYLITGDRLVVVDASDAPLDVDFSKHEIFQHQQVFYIRSDKGRAKQMNAGAEFLLSQAENNTKTSMLWFLHCDSGLSAQHLEYIRSLMPSTLWGRFDVQLNPSTFPFKIIASLMNLRSRLSQVMTGDQGIFICSDLFYKIGGYAQIPLMEDVEISKRLRKIAKADCAGPRLTTSARRWQQQGIVKTVLLMWQLRLMYWLGVSPTSLVKKYYG